MKKLFLCLIIALFITMPMVFAEGETAVQDDNALSGGPGETAIQSVGQEFEYYENSDGTLTINKYNGVSGSIVVPAELDGKRVTRVYELGLGTGDAITSIEFSEGIERISSYLLNKYPDLQLPFIFSD